MKHGRQKWLFWLFGAWFVLSTVYLKVYFHTREEYRTAQTYIKAGNIRLAIRHYGFAIRWYTPGNRFSRVSISRLLQIGKGAYQRGDWEQATRSYQHLRNALASLKGSYQPHQSSLILVQKRLAEVLAHLVPPSETKPIPLAQRQKVILALLHQDDFPAPWVSFLIMFGYAAWLFCAAYLCWNWSSSSRKEQILWGLGAIACFLVWFVTASIG